MYAPLWCKSNFSFLEGASHPEELVDEAHRLGLRAIALTDRDGVSGMVRAYTQAKAHGVQLLCGAQLTMAAPGALLADSPLSLGDRDGRGPGWGRDTDDLDPAPRRSAVTGRRARPARGRPRQAARLDAPTSTLVVLATNRTGWANLTRLLTAGRRRCDKGASLIGWPELCRHAEGLLALWGGAGSLLDAVEAPPASLLDELRAAFGDRLYALLTRHRLADDVERERRLRARVAGTPIVAGCEVLYHTRARRALQDVLTCIRHGVTLDTAGMLLRPNDEHDLHAPYPFSTLFADDPGAVARTLEVAARCTFSLAELRYRYPSERLPGGSTSAQYLRALAYAGAGERAQHGAIKPAVRAQLDAELALIEELDYPGYFLTMYEIVSYCRRRDIVCQGRGSAANSVVCYSLGITAIDPIEMNLLFERFLSRERAEPPDIDLDIEHERREEVIQHVYTVYGRDHAAMVCNVIRYRPRSAIRDVGKVFGIPEVALDRVAKQLSAYGLVKQEALAGAGLAEHSMLAHVARMADEILEFPRHLSIHPGGFLLGHEPVHDIVPIENGAMPDRTVIQWDKDDLEELGLFKVDLLALGALHQLHLAFDLLRKHRDETWTLATIPREDAETYQMMWRADTVGVFQIESRAQMSMLPRLRPKTFYDLVIEVSLVRPGPISGGMVHPYLRRRAGLEEVTYPHESLKDVLEKTNGVPLFQEQVMKLAMIAADYTPGEADQLRRDMAAWRRSGRIEGHRSVLINRMENKGIPREFAERVFEQIRGFGEYGFPESHAASFALIAYATSWVRCHRMPEFTCALLNAQPMGFYSPATIVGDAQRHGVAVRPIDVQHSDWDCTLEPGDGTFAVRMGLRWIKGLTVGEGERIVARRPYASLADFTQRLQLEARTYAALAEAGAFGAITGDDRRAALWQVRGWAVRQADTLPVDPAEDELSFAPLGKLDRIFWDYLASDHSTIAHPLAPLRGELTAQRLPDARTVQQGLDGQHISYVGVVICRQQPGTASGVVFMTLEDETGFVNLVVWKQVFARYDREFRTQSLLGITGKLQRQEDIVHLIAEHVFVPQLSRQLLSVDSRDFH